MAAEISLKRIKRQSVEIEVVGTAPLIAHRWSEKALKDMLASQQGKKKVREIRDPEADFQAAMYRFPDGGHGFPVMGFKRATISGGGRAFGKAVKMTELRQHLFFQHDGEGTDGAHLIRLKADEPLMGENWVRLSLSSNDLRYRPYYANWSAVLRIQYSPNIIDAESILALVDAGGTNGVGDWRPERNGSFGTYEVSAMSTS